MRIQVLYFAYCRDLMGRDQEEMDLHEEARVSDLLARCIAEKPALEAVRKNLLVAVNQEYARTDQALAEGDEVALFPPVSGGTAEIQQEEDIYAVIRDAIEPDRYIQALKKPEDGAVVTFQGIVRNNSRGKQTRYVEYHGYEPMALKKIREIGERIKYMWEVDRVAIVHRLGHLEIGETSVLIVTTAAHRKAAFDACHYAIDLLKRTVPIWKKECYEDGEVWIEGDIPVKPCHEG